MTKNSHGFNSDQQTAFDAFMEWRESGDEEFRLYGFAGTGKSYVASKIEAEIPGATFVTYTGKAAHVLRRRGVKRVSTIHGAIYSIKNSDEAILNLKREVRRLHAQMVKQHPGKSFEALRKINPELERLAANLDTRRQSHNGPAFNLNEEADISLCPLIIVDECSMVGSRVAADLRKFGVPILAMGDPGQLPPVKDQPGFKVAKPDAMLTKLMRTAEEAPIAHLAARVRKGERLTKGTYGESEVVGMHRIKDDELLAYNQIIVGTHKMRRRVNNRVRRAKGFTSPFPEIGDKLVCLRNLEIDDQTYLANGALWRVIEKIGFVDDEIMLTLEEVGTEKPDGSKITVTLGVPLSCFDPDDEDGARFEQVQFDYGYAITAHKAQGSEWAGVLVYDESRVFRDDATRWLYTAITRASQYVTVAQVA